MYIPRMYRFHWFGGTISEVYGFDVADALTKLGAVDLRYLEWWEVVK